MADGNSVLAALGATLDANVQTRQAGEAHLHALAQQMGYGTVLLQVCDASVRSACSGAGGACCRMGPDARSTTVLCWGPTGCNPPPQIALAHDVPEAVRQAAAVLLKNYIRVHWQVGGAAARAAAMLGPASLRRAQGAAAAASPQAPGSLGFPLAAGGRNQLQAARGVGRRQGDPASAAAVRAGGPIIARAHGCPLPSRPLRAPGMPARRACLPGLHSTGKDSRCASPQLQHPERIRTRHEYSAPHPPTGCAPCRFALPLAPALPASRASISPTPGLSWWTA